MSPTVASYNEFSSESIWEEAAWPISHDGEGNDNYALSHQGEDLAWVSPNLLASSESSSAAQPIPHYDLSDHTQSIAYGFQSHTYGGANHRSTHYDLAGLTASPTQPTHSFGSSWQDQ